MRLSLRIALPTLLLLVLPACQAASEQPNIEDDESAAEMLQHNVYFYLNDDVTSEERAQFEEGLRELLQIETIYRAEMGVPGATEERDVTDHEFAYSIFAWFETMEDYEVYAEHPDHLEFIDAYSDLWADVRVYDSEIIDTP